MCAPLDWQYAYLTWIKFRNPRKIFEKWLFAKINPLEINFKNSSAKFEIGMLSNFPNVDPFLSLFAYFKQLKKYIIKQ